MEHRNETHAQGRIGDDAPMAGRSDIRLPPRSLREALRDAGIRPGYTRVDSETPSEEDYDKNIRPSLTSSGIRQRVQRSATEEQSPILARSSSGVHTIHEGENRSHQISETSTGQENGPQSMSSKKAGKVRDFVFTRQFSAFDRNNTTATSSPFHGFYTLFWMGVAIFVLKISAENWRTYGDPFGTKDIMRTMFSRDGETHPGFLCGKNMC